MAIRVLNRFPGANVRVLTLRAEGADPEIVFAPDPHGGPDSLWFHFRVDDPSPPPSPPASVTLTLQFFDSLPDATDPGKLRPVTREPGKNWFRLKPPSVTRLPDGQQSLSWTLPYPTTGVEVALCYPYFRDEFALLLDHGKGYWTEDGIGLTQAGRVLTRLRNDVAEGSAACPHPHGLYVVARQQAGETPGSWVLDGLLSAFARAKPVNWCVWAVPFADLDGVVAGDHGGGAVRVGLDGAWSLPPLRHEAQVLQQDLRRWAGRCRPDLVLDLRAAGACDSDGVFAQLDDADAAESNRATQAWANVLQQALMPEFGATPFARKAADAARRTTPQLGAFVREQLGCSALALHTPYALCGETLLMPKQYREVGQRIARAILTRR